MALVLAMSAGPLTAQISPGPLARPHQQLEGTLRCVACHGVARKTEMNALCIECHKEIGWLVERRRGLHARVAEQRCASCHPDHAGVDFAMIDWPGRDSSRFDHARAGWPLDGKHGELKCAECHKPALRVAAAARLSPRRGPDWGWVGLEQGCVTCHKDPHRGRLGSACTDCHGTKSFKAISRTKFNHDRTRYPLRGRHAAVRCERCHDFSSPGKLAAGSLQFATCGACHRDAHAGTATLARRTVDCASCHAVDGWKPATYTVAQHRQATYRLEGRHERVSCSACHVKNPPAVPAATLGTSAVWMRPVAARCQSCHADDHNGQLARRAGGAACEGCHKVAGWTPTTYTTAAHATLRLDLSGRHGEIACAACHGPVRRGLAPLASTQVLGKAGVALTLGETACVACHVDPHRGRVPRCLDCHDTKTFRPSTIDIAAHRRYRLPLEGAHRAVPCVSCHTAMKHAAASSTLVLAGWTFGDVLFSGPQGGCAGCHETPHGNQFAARADRGACDKCHGVAAFRPAPRFDHDRDASFTLKGAHAAVACARCHTTKRNAAGMPVVLYRPLSGKCETCHGDEIRRGS